VIAAVIAGLKATSALEALSVLLGLAYLLLAVRRDRWCWLAGGASSAILVYLSARARLPMQAALQVYYVAMSVYGFWYWSAREGAAERNVTTWPLRLHLAALGAILFASVVSARLLAAETRAAWPYLDSLTSWSSLFATWLVARVKLENWVYWFVIDAALAFLFAAQKLYFVALLSIIYVGIVVVGFLSWLKPYRQRQAAPAQ
jgi:nicotinamide mononucleotide transporter